ncbi:uncharacterized protein CYBJADRAFT_162268, partial [Cyberlindnera jadinii NRRL Y-1542]
MTRHAHCIGMMFCFCVITSREFGNKIDQMKKHPCLLSSFIYKDKLVQLMLNSVILPLTFVASLVVSTPPACFLSCIDHMARTCEESHTDFECFCDNSPSVLGCLVDICPYGTFFSARDHFWGTCVEMLEPRGLYEQDEDEDEEQDEEDEEEEEQDEEQDEEEYDNEGSKCVGDYDMECHNETAGDGDNVYENG